MVSNLLKMLTIILINSFMASKCVDMLYDFNSHIYHLEIMCMVVLGDKENIV